jgi:methylmalonyl-CoA carboxyltransferase large subunit
MKSETVDGTQVTDTLAALRQELARLGERVAALEAAASVGRSVTPSHNTAPAPAAEDLSDELLAVISAAVAAFLGKKPHIRQIRLLGAVGWAQHGRATIQASHSLPVHHTRSQP